MVVEALAIMFFRESEVFLYRQWPSAYQIEQSFLSRTGQMTIQLGQLVELVIHGEVAGGVDVTSISITTEVEEPTGK